MDRTREARRVAMTAGSSANGLSRRRHRSSSLRDSPEDDVPVELQETARLRDRKKDRERERERERERDRERDRDRERERERERDRLSRTSKRRRGDRLISNREDGGDDSSEESINDDEDDEDEDGGTGGGGSVRILQPNNTASLSISNHHHHHQQQHQHRKSFPPPVKVIRTTPPAGTTMTTNTTSFTWKGADEMIGVSVPRKARSASTKRSHEWASSGSVIGGEQSHRQPSTSPVRTGAAGMLKSPSPAPASPSSSNASMRKKMKPNGPKQRPPKSSSKSSSSAQEEIEIEIAEVLYGLMRQPQVPAKQEVIGNDLAKFDSREVNKPNNDAKSRVSSPISNSPSTLLQSTILPSNSNSSATPMSVIAPKRKKPRPIKYEDDTTNAVALPAIFPVRNSCISSTTAKVEIDHPAKIEVSSPPNLEKNSGSVAENGGGSYDLMNSSQAGLASSELVQAEPVKEEKNNLVADSKPLTEESESGDINLKKKEDSQSPKKESSSSPANNPSSIGLRLDDERANMTVTKANSTGCEIESQREEKFQIDLMAPPPSRSSPERDGEIDFGASDPKLMATDKELEMKSMTNDDDKRVKIGKVDVNVEVGEDSKKDKLINEEAITHKSVVNKERNIDLQLDLEKSDSGTGSVNANKLNHHVQKLQHQQPSLEKTAQSGSLPLPMSMASWPGGLPPMGYVAPLQGVVSMDGSAVSSAAIQPQHLLFSQPRPKRCATHCYIARNIHYQQQFMKMNPFWPAAPGSASLYGYKTCNLNVVPPTELHGNVPGRVVNSVQDKGQGLAVFPGHVGKDKGPQSAANMVDAASRKQILLQQALPPGAPSNILHGPAFIFPLSQQQAAAAASVRPGSVKSPPASGSTTSSSTSNSAPVSATAPAGAAAAAAPAMSFNYPNMPGSETQYLAFLQNNGYPFPIPAHVGAPPAYRGNHAQPMPFIHGSFYSSQMLHPSQLQQQQQQQQPPPTQLQQSQQGHQNTSMSSGSSSSQKHLQNQQQKPHGSGMSSGSGNLQVFPAPKNQPLPLQHQQRQQQPSQHASNQARQFDGELGGQNFADSRVSRANMNFYGQNFAMPLPPPNFALMTAASVGGSSSSGGSHGEKKQQVQQPSQQPSAKAGVEPLTSQAFAVSFASINGTTAPGLDISSFAQNHAILQNLPESTRQGYQQMMAAAAVAAQQQKKNNYHGSDDGKRGPNDASTVEEERKAMGAKVSATIGQSIAFSRPDLCESSVTAIPGNNVIDSSARTLNLGSAQARTSGSIMPASISGVSATNAQQQLQRSQQQQQQQMLQLQKSHQFGAAAPAPRSKTSVTSNGNAYSDLPSSSMAAKFPNSLSAFPQNLVQSSSSPAQSPQWKNSVRTSTSQVPSPSLSSTSSSIKNIPQQQGRPQQSHTQISFAANPKSATQGQQPPSSTPSPSPPMVVGSPTTSVSRSAGGSPRTTGSTSTGNKGGQASSLSSQQAKNSTPVPNRKSSPSGGRSVPSVLGNQHISTSANSGAKPQVSLQQQQHQHQHQHQHQKHGLHPAPLFFSNPYMQAQAQAQHSPHTTATATVTGGFYLQRHRNDQQQTQPPGSCTTSTSMLSVCSPVSLANTGTTDPAKAVVAAAAAAAAAAGNMKGGGLPSQGLIHAAQFATSQSSGKPHHLVPGFPYVHAVPAAVQIKPAEQKQPAGE